MISTTPPKEALFTAAPGIVNPKQVTSLGSGAGNHAETHAPIVCGEWRE